LSENNDLGSSFALARHVTIFEALVYHSMSVKTNAARFQSSQMLLKEALETYTQIGMPRHIEIAQALLG
jgi:hypothetical protein